MFERFPDPLTITFEPSWVCFSCNHVLADQFRLREKANFDQGTYRRLLDRRLDEFAGRHMQASIEVEGFERRMGTWERKEIVDSYSPRWGKWTDTWHHEKVL